MVHRLRRIELGDRRQNPEGVAGQHDDVARMAGPTGGRGVGDKGQRIGDAGVLGLRFVVEIGNAQFRVEDDVLHHRAEALGRRIDLGLGLARELDRLGVAAAFEVEDAAFAPAVLVVPDEDAVRVGGERRLAGAGKTEENRGVALFADIGRAMAANSWQQLYQQYKLYAHCDDGAIAEGFSEAVTRLLSDRWRDIRELEAILKDARRFRDFVVRHVDETVPADRLDSIAKNATRRCPRNMKSLCSDIASAAARAKKAM